jgi:hypothetical protein
MKKYSYFKVIFIIFVVIVLYSISAYAEIKEVTVDCTATSFNSSSYSDEKFGRYGGISRYIYISSPDLSVIPYGAKITGATLNIRLTSIGQTKVEAYLFLVSKLTGSLSTSNCDLFYPSIGYASMNGWGASEYNFDVTNSVKMWVNGEIENKGFVFTPPTGNEGCHTFREGQFVTIKYEIDDNFPIILNTNINKNHDTTGKLLSIIPSANLFDAENKNLTCKLYKIVNLSKTLVQTCYATSPQYNVTFSPINVSVINSPNTSLLVDVSDGVKSQSKNMPFDLSDKTFQINNLSIQTSTNSISVKTNVSNVTKQKEGKFQYKYTIDDFSTEYIGQNNFTKQNLMPNTQYNIKVEVIDTDSNNAEQISTVYTKALVPIFAVEKNSNQSQKINIKDSNPNYTNYCVYIDDGSRVGYINEQGEVVWNGSEIWGQFVSKEKIVEIPLGSNYKIKIKARNSQNIETNYSDVHLSY